MKKKNKANPTNLAKAIAALSVSVVISTALVIISFTNVSWVWPGLVAIFLSALIIDEFFRI